MNDYYDAPPYMMGFATPLHYEADADPVQALHDVVREVTGKPVDPAPRHPMGFIE